MDIVILQSAFKHGVTAESIYSCLFNCRSDIMLENLPITVSPKLSRKGESSHMEEIARRLIVGFDQRGVALEIIALEEIEHNRLVVSHAMKLRKKYYHLLQEDVNEL